MPPTWIDLTIDTPDIPQRVSQSPSPGIEILDHAPADTSAEARHRNLIDRRARLARRGIYEPDIVPIIDGPPPRQRRRVDPDVQGDDADVILIPNEEPRRRSRPATPQHRRVLFSPSPPPQDNTVPPVPPVPPQFLHNFNFQDFFAPVDQPPPPRTLPPRRNMGLGGALMSLRMPALANTIMQRAFNPSRNPPINQPPPINDLDAVFQYRPGGFHLRDFLFRGQPTGPSTPDYLPTMSHPDKPNPGFTFDIAPQTSPPLVPTFGKKPQATSSSVEKPPPVLICAHCLTPLIINGDRDSRIWGLQCGHILDGKCINKLSWPRPIPEPVLESVKEKVKVTEESQLNGAPDGGIRARLRSRPTMPVASRPIRRRGAQSTGPPSPRKDKGKGRQRGKANAVEDEFNWFCPVQDCGKVHTSVKIAGVWRAGGIPATQGKGAIPVFA